MIFHTMAELAGYSHTKLFLHETLERITKQVSKTSIANRIKAAS